MPRIGLGDDGGRSVLQTIMTTRIYFAAIAIALAAAGCPRDHHDREHGHEREHAEPADDGARIYPDGID